MDNTNEIPFDVLRNIENSLSRLDRAIQTTAQSVDGKIYLYNDFVPQRSIVVEAVGKLSRKLGIYPVLRSAQKGWQSDNYFFVFAVHVWLDKHGKRFVWDKTVTQRKIIPETYPETLALLEECWTAAKDVKEKDLKAPKF